MTVEGCKQDERTYHRGEAFVLGHGAEQGGQDGSHSQLVQPVCDQHVDAADGWYTATEVLYTLPSSIMIMF